MLSFDSADNFASLNLDPSLDHLQLDVAEESFKTTFSPEQCEALFSLKKECAAEQISRVLHLLFPAEIAQRGAGELKGADWNSIVLFVYLELTAAAEHFGKDFADEQETFTIPQTQEVEKATRASASEFFIQMTALKYVREFGTSLPEVVRRARQLEVVSVGSKVPPNVWKYLLAASRCYILGEFLASLFVCRSAVAAALEDRLRAKGHGNELGEVGQRSLFELLNIAKTKGALNGAEIRVAHELRMLARDAIHGKRLPSEHECDGALNKTRKLLAYLYA